jgi:anti-sigma regulatory factor (Ser/Thr protein kinase)
MRYLEGANERSMADGGAPTVLHEFPSTPASVGNARHALDDLVGELGDPVHMTAVLLVSELVTNSVQHSKAPDGTIELLASVTPEHIRVEVRDDGEGFDPPPVAHHDAESGRGLQLVQELADRWGRPKGPRATVWFEIDRTKPRARAAAPTALRPMPTPELSPAT